ncbi:MAG: ABC transporter ATP-binding protein [Nitrospira bacterium HGW-Nitrospira-1]|nr:MAG: ABC transporter ATP-binding protein [Nitrospira bacterium HGW-Nitrospira-1]
MNLRLAITHISKSYEGKTVLNDCSFSFDRKGVYILTGPNGSGKSTFLRIAALIESPDRGEVRYFSDDEVLENDILLRRRMTLVLPRIGLFNTTVYGNMAYGLKVMGMQKKEREEKVCGYLEAFGLLHKKKQNALTLSSGESQRLGIARAMVTEPDLLFLDEPTASVDQKNSELIEEIILKMKKQGNPTVIMTTHDTGQAERLADFRIRITPKNAIAFFG